MKPMKKSELERLRKIYPAGTRIKLLRMDDEQAPPIGSEGTVRRIDDIGNILVQWDNGSMLNAVYGEDVVEIISEK